MSDKKTTVGIDPALPGSEETVYSQFGPSPILRRLLELTRNGSDAKFRKEYLNEFPTPPEPKTVYIVARDVRTARNYSGWYRHHIENNPDIVFKFVGRKEDLVGLKNVEIHLVTTWQLHYQAWQIKEFVDELVQSGRATVKEVEW